MIEAIVRKQGGGTHRVWLRELTGHDELDVTGSSGAAASRLVLALMSVPGRRKAEASELTLTERDQLLAAIHADCFGDRIESVVACTKCEQRTDLAFSLGALVEDTVNTEADARFAGPDREGLWTVSGVGRFRLPTAEDEAALTGLEASEIGAALAKRCIVGSVADNVEAFDSALERVAPLLDTDLDVECAGCGTGLRVHFDIVTFFSKALERERQLVFREVHRLAGAYHWALDEILSLPRSQRRAHVALIEGERGPSRRAG